MKSIVKSLCVIFVSHKNEERLFYRLCGLFDPLTFNQVVRGSNPRTLSKKQRNPWEYRDFVIFIYERMAGK